MSRSEKTDWRGAILQLLRENPDRCFRQRELAKRLGVQQSEMNTFNIAVKHLLDSKEIRRAKKGQYCLGRENKFREGKLTINQKGFGFVLQVGEEADIYIGRRNLGNAVNGDIVRVKLLPGRRFEGPRGVVERVVTRGTDRFVGTVYQEGTQQYLAIQPVNPPRGIRLLPAQYVDYLSGQVVVAEVKDWGDYNSPVLARVSAVLGKADDPSNDIKVVLAKYGYSLEFPQQVENEVNRISQAIIENERSGRKDYRSIMTFTIDPETARDFDDAISLERNENGYRLLVHIADVSFFVRTGTALDREARNRGTSVYFDEATIHMLPEKLSAELCSLQPEVDRLSMTAVIELNHHYQVQSFKVGPAIINSNYRFTYQQVQAIIDGKTEHSEKKRLLDLRRVCKAFYDQRVKLGSIDFDIPEPHFVIGEDGIPREITPSERLESHRMVEECMLLANRLVAEKVPVSGEQLRPFLYRIHDEPPVSDVEGFLDLLRRLGITFHSSEGRLSSAGMRDILLQVENSPYRNLVENLALRTMTKAMYAAEKRGHFGLAFSAYTHFTSPIRRYPDLAVHRLIREYTGKYKEQERTQYKDLAAIAESSTACEIQALIAEREYEKLKQLRWLQNQIDKGFTGVISGVTSIGFYVELAHTLVEGLVHISTLESDEFVYDPDNYCIRGRRHNKRFSIGDEVRIIVQEVLIDKLRANFRMVD